MRGTGHTLSRQTRAFALFAGVMSLAWTCASATQAQIADSGVGGGVSPRHVPWDDTHQQSPATEAALLIPHINLRGKPASVAAPRPLEPSEAVRVRRIFALQARGDMAKAEHATTELRDDLLLASLSADRLLGRTHKSTVADLTAWLDAHGDHPDAPAIYALLLRKLPHGTRAPPAPIVASLANPGEPHTLPEDLIRAIAPYPLT